MHGRLTRDTPEAIAASIREIAANPAEAADRAEAALNRLMAEFRMDPGIARLSERLQQMLGP